MHVCNKTQLVLHITDSSLTEPVCIVTYNSATQLVLYKSNLTQLVSMVTYKSVTQLVLF